MKCLHCLVEFHAEREDLFIGEDADKIWAIEKYNCPACQRDNLFLVNYLTKISYPRGYLFQDEISRRAIRPRGSKRPPCPTEVPNDITADYKEACLILDDSPKASAALSRRCLQMLLRDAAKVKPSDLSNEIDQVLSKGDLPTHISEIVDAVRNVGNFAAHPQKSISTGLILPVETDEAEWNLEVLETLFDFYYVLPEKTKQKQDALNRKLTDAGKPPMKVKK